MLHAPADNERKTAASRAIRPPHPPILTCCIKYENRAVASATLAVFLLSSQCIIYHLTVCVVTPYRKASRFSRAPRLTTPGPT